MVNRIQPETRRQITKFVTDLVTLILSVFLGLLALVLAGRMGSYWHTMPTLGYLGRIFFFLELVLLVGITVFLCLGVIGIAGTFWSRSRSRLPGPTFGKDSGAMAVAETTFGKDWGAMAVAENNTIEIPNPSFDKDWGAMAIAIDNYNLRISSFRRLNRGRPDMSLFGAPGATGFCVRRGKKQWILTNHHVIEAATQVEVRRSGESQVFMAQVYETAPMLDMALLTVDDADFWQGAVFPEIQSILPNIGDRLFQVGFPGDRTRAYRKTKRENVTQGILVSIEKKHLENSYQLFKTPLLLSDVRGNGGDSGGPLLNAQGQLVGVNVQGKIDNWSMELAIAIPAYVVKYFLDQVHKKGDFQGVQGIDLEDYGFATMDTSPATCEFYGMVPTGMYCDGFLFVGPDKQPVLRRRRDIIIGIGGQPTKRTHLIPPGCNRCPISKSEDIVYRPVNNRGFMAKGQSGYWVDHQLYTNFQNGPFTLLFRSFNTKAIGFQVMPGSREEETQNFKSNRKDPPITYVLLGGYLFFDVNPDSLTELELKPNGHRFPPEFYALRNIVRNTRKRGILMYRSVPHESTEGNMVTRVSLVEKCNNQEIKTIETLMKKVKEKTSNNFLIIRCSMPGVNEQTICVDKRKRRQDALFIKECLGIKSVRDLPGP